MAVEIDIAGTIVSIPSTGSQPVWSEPIIQGFEAIADALSGLVGEGDIGRQIFNLDNSHNPGTDVVLTGLSFNPTLIRGAFIRYTVARSTTSPDQSITEIGEMRVLYNIDNPSTTFSLITSRWIGNYFHAID